MHALRAEEDERVVTEYVAQMEVNFDRTPGSIPRRIFDEALKILHNNCTDEINRV